MWIIYWHFGAEAPVFVLFCLLRFWAKARSEKPELHPELKQRAIERYGYPNA
jgi:hypothetical protein